MLMPKLPKPSKVERISLDNRDLVLPFFSSNDVPECYCARMVRFAAEFMFGKKFPVANAWNMRKKRGIMLRSVDNSAFESLAAAGVIPPGIIAGFYNKDSVYNGKNRLYTHLGLYIGRQKSKSLFIDQYVNEIRVLNLEDYQKQHLELREIIDVVPKNHHL